MNSHREAIKCGRKTRDMLEELLDRDDIGGMDETGRARRMRVLEVLKRRWPPGVLDAVSDRARRKFQLDLLKRRWQPISDRAQRQADLEHIRQCGRRLGVAS
jgi:hypothetical protein